MKVRVFCQKRKLIISTSPLQLNHSALVRKITVLHLCQRDCLWIFRFEDRPMTILVFNQTRIFVNILDRNHNLWRLWATYSKDLQQSVDLFCQPCLCLLIDILWCNFWFSIPFPLDEYEMFTVTWVFEGALWHPEALTYPWPMCIIWNGRLCQFLGLQCSEFSSSFHVCSWM